MGALDLRKSCWTNGLSQARGDPMQTECSADLFGFARVEGRVVVAVCESAANWDPAPARVTTLIRCRRIH
jgi:hypothetical protein